MHYKLVTISKLHSLYKDCLWNNNLSWYIVEINVNFNLKTGLGLILLTSTAAVSFSSLFLCWRVTIWLLISWCRHLRFYFMDKKGSWHSSQTVTWTSTHQTVHPSPAVSACCYVVSPWFFHNKLIGHPDCNVWCHCNIHQTKLKNEYNNNSTLSKQWSRLLYIMFTGIAIIVY